VAEIADFRFQIPDFSMQSDAVPSDLADAFAMAGDRLAEFARPLMYFSTVASTNDVAATLAARGRAHGTVVVAEHQTAGRGRRGRTWFSPPGSGLYVSVVWDPRRGDGMGRGAADAERATALLTLAAGLALAEAVEAITGLGPDIKWPNDLVLHGRKIAGILAEGVSGGAGISSVVLGYGINVGRMSYPPELAAKASSLETELGRAVDRAALCAETVASLARRSRDLASGRFDAILDAWSTRSPASRGSRVSWQTPDGPLSGTTQGIDDRGALLVGVDGGVERIHAGEVVWL
jgi:BirA family biotin operon repressor/biotin-[acetyl-CoA-carboxylase] ligase